MKRCIKCLEVKEIEDFSIRRDNIDNRHTVCRVCVNESTLIREQNKQLGIPPRTRFEISKIAKETRNNFEELVSKELLEQMGYDLNSELSVHEQFLIKHNLI